MNPNGYGKYVKLQRQENTDFKLNRGRLYMGNEAGYENPNIMKIKEAYDKRTKSNTFKYSDAKDQLVNRTKENYQKLSLNQRQFLGGRPTQALKDDKDAVRKRQRMLAEGISDASNDVGNEIQNALNKR